MPLAAKKTGLYKGNSGRTGNFEWDIGFFNINIKGVLSLAVYEYEAGCTCMLLVYTACESSLNKAENSSFFIKICCNSGTPCSEFIYGCNFPIILKPTI